MKKLTLKNIQIDCTDLTEVQIKQMADVFIDNGIKVDFTFIYKSAGHFFMSLCSRTNDVWLREYQNDLTTITYEKFMELFDKKKVNEMSFSNLSDINVKEVMGGTLDNRKSYPKELKEKKPTLQKVEIFNPQPHYDNTNGSLYKIGTERKWNPYLFDVVKRLERGGKKDPLKQEIEKSIDVLKIWLNELGE